MNTFDITLSHFNLIHECDRRTNRNRRGML